MMFLPSSRTSAPRDYTDPNSDFAVKAALQAVNQFCETNLFFSSSKKKKGPVLEKGGGLWAGKDLCYPPMSIGMSFFFFLFEGAILKSRGLSGDGIRGGLTETIFFFCKTATWNWDLQALEPANCCTFEKSEGLDSQTPHFLIQISKEST